MKAVSAWTTTDGKVFTNQKEAQAHELRLLRSDSAKQVANKIAGEIGSHEVGGESILEALMNNADELIAALSVKIPSNRGRKSKTEAA